MNYIINERWRKKLFNVCVFAIAISLIAEIVIYLIDSNTRTLFLPLRVYRIRFIYIPAFLNLIFLLISYKCVFASKLSDKAKNTCICLFIYFIGANIQVVHYVYAPLMVLPVISIFISVIFGNRKLTHLMALVSLFSLFAASLLAAHEQRQGDVQLISDCGISAIIIIVALVAADSMIDYVSEQLKHLIENTKRESLLIHELHIDTLMGINNRLALDEQLENCVNFDYTNNNSHMLLIDIDDFKQINDSYGHLNGDEVLIKLSELIKHHISHNITAYRYGGEEIVIIVQNYSADYAYQLAENLRVSFSEQRYDFAPERTITFSCGLATLHIKQSTKEWLQNSDNALYEAKRHGKNQTVKL